MRKTGMRVYAAAEVPFLLAFGVPALLIGCVIGGVWVLVALLRRQKTQKASAAAKGETSADAPDDTNKGI